MSFKRKSLIKRAFMPLPELEKYYCDKRKYLYTKNKPIQGRYFRKIIHKLLVVFVKADRKCSGEHITVIGKKIWGRYHKPLIFAATHIGGNDIQRIFEAIKEHAYLFLGDPRGLYRDVNGLMLHLNGCIWMETKDKEDRHIGKMTAEKLLKSGENILIFPEGAWNITENLPVMQLYRGTADLALECNADIIPVAIEQYDQMFWINIGDSISADEMNCHDREQLTEYIRDALAALKWEIWEQQGIVHRECIPLNFLDAFHDEIIARCPYDYTLDDVEDTRYHDKAAIEWKQTVKDLKRIALSKDNCYLFDRRNSGKLTQEEKEPRLVGKHGDTSIVSCVNLKTAINRRSYPQRLLLKN